MQEDMEEEGGDGTEELVDWIDEQHFAFCLNSYTR